MRKLFAGALLLSASLFSASSASAATVLTFEGAGDVTPVGGFYNGGASVVGNAGTNYGIQFSDNAYSLIDKSAGGSGRQANDPSGVTTLYFNSGNATTMNVAAGFTKALSFYYAATEAGSVTIYDGLNGTGNVLATLDLSANLTHAPFNAWSLASVNFSGDARSVAFGGNAAYIAFDNISLGAVPEVSTWAMMILGVGLAGAAMRRRKISVSYSA